MGSSSGATDTRSAGGAEVAVLIPALNAGASIGPVVNGARQFIPRVLVVDDGSSDETAPRAAGAGAAVVRHSTTGGKGAALVTGLRALAEGGIEHAVTMDADGQHLAQEIPALLRAARDDPQAIVIGVRQIPPGATTPMRLFGNRFANRWVEIACGRALPDTQSGFRVYPVRSVLA